LDCAAIPLPIKLGLRQQLRALDPFVLKKRITRLQTQLLGLVRRKNMKILGPPSGCTERCSGRGRGYPDMTWLQKMRWRPSVKVLSRLKSRFQANSLQRALPVESFG